MSDYISRDELFDNIRNDVAPFNVAMVFRHIHNIPAADVVEVRCGRWYLAEDAVFRCSECGRICYELDAPYCYCGARMEKESEHETD